MPILDVELVNSPDDAHLENLAQRIAESAAAVLHSPPGETWVKVSVIPLEMYAENAGGPPEGVVPVFVRVMKREVEHGERLQAEVKALTAAIAEACARPVENVHLVYAPDAKGRVSFGGHLVED